MDSDLNHHPCTGGVAAGSEGQTSHTALGFSSVRDLLKAGALLRDSGFSVLAVPRRVRGCGVLLLIESSRTQAACSLLADKALEPGEIMPYPRVGSDPVSNPVSNS
jgi:hypothetical protein